MNQITRIILIISVFVVVAIGIVIFSIILFKVFKLKKKIKENENEIAKRLLLKKSEQKMINREDFGEPLVELQKKIGTTINHEIVEFCINSCIRNEFKNVLFVKNVESYEVITLSNKANVNVYVRRDDFDNFKYQELKKNQDLVTHHLNIEDKIENINFFDSIMVLNSKDNFEKIFIENIDFLKNKGMFIFANTKSNKKSLKRLIREVENKNYKYDVINWYTGFVTIVKNNN